MVYIWQQHYNRILKSLCCCEQTVTAGTLYEGEASGVPAGLGVTELFIDFTYEAILTALNRAASISVPYHKKKAFSKFWWDQEMKSLKEDAQSTHIIWISAGKPRSGIIFQNRNKAKNKYRLHIKENKANEKLLITNKLQSELCSKNSRQFWKTWK